MSFQIDLPNHTAALAWMATRRVTPNQLQSIVQQLSDVAAYSMLDSLRSHVRSGQTIQSIEAWIVEASSQRYALAVGSRSRGSVLRWLDVGRGEVRPKHLTPSGQPGWLRYTARDGSIIFSRYSRPTTGIQLMQRAKDAVAAKAGQAVEAATAAPS